MYPLHIVDGEILNIFTQEKIVELSIVVDISTGNLVLYGEDLIISNRYKWIIKKNPNLVLLKLDTEDVKAICTIVNYMYASLDKQEIQVLVHNIQNHIDLNKQLEHLRHIGF